MPTPFFADLVRELCQGGGTGPLTPTGAVPGHRRFSDAVPGGAAFHYSIAGIARPDQWEVGLGRIVDGKLVRDTVAASSNGGAAVDFAIGLKTLALTVGAAWFSGQGGALAALDAQALALTAAVAERQPLSTSHPGAALAAGDDLVTLRRGAGWVNVPAAALAFRDAAGRYELGGVLAAPGGSAAAPSISFAGDSDTGVFRAGADILALATGGGERLRVTASGLVGVGTASPGYLLDVQAASGGIFARFRQSTSANVGFTIGGDVNGGWCGNGAQMALEGIYFQNGVGLRVYANSVERMRIESGGTVRPFADNSQALGAASARWSVIYAGTGTINTSDAREKLWRSGATVAELAAARRIADALGFFQWTDAIAAKGADGARLHFGVRAQAVWAIMADEGLIDPLNDGAAPDSRYAFLCWDEGAGDAEGAPPTPRFGIRPDQLALFLIAAQAARIAALEAAA